VLQVENRIASEVFVPRVGQWRETITFPVIRAAKLRMVLCAGEGKQKILKNVREGADYPVTRATAGGIETWWFVDRAAAGFPA
jgi:6-phosphogluconolactonase/glucosamine-6-phosphate isomerase/deaminase